MNKYLISVAASERAERRLNRSSSGIDVALQGRRVVAGHYECRRELDRLVLVKGIRVG